MKQSSQGKKGLNQTQIAQKRFELENEIMDEEKTYRYDEDQIQALLASRPWKQNPDYFKHVKISAVALIKMVMHTRSGGDIEVMGVMQGYPVGDTMYIMDAFGLPVEGTETRVNAGKEADEYLINHMEKCESVARPEYIVGWYHSHPGYGCWLSGIDVMTQQNYQKIQDPSIAIVIDPKRTMAAGKVEIGCFRAYQDGHAEKVLQSYKGSSGSAVIPGEKFDEFGLHAHKYYKVDHSFFKSGLDTTLLDRLWNEYWVHTLSSSPLLSNQDIICKSVINVVDKITLLHSKQGGFSSRRERASSGTFGPSKVIDEEKYDPIATESSKVAVDVTHGILTEALKKFMFACKQARPAARSEDAEMREESKKV